jgi:Tol biopolymer transport system component
VFVFVVALAAALAGIGAATQPRANAAAQQPGRVVFSTGRDGYYEIFVMNADGSGQTNLTNNNGNQIDDFGPVWSPDGTKIAVSSGQIRIGAHPDIYVMNADGSGLTNLTNHSLGDSEPAWKPDGTRLAFHTNRTANDEIFVMNADGSGQTNVTNNPAPDFEPAWSPDGTKIAFKSYRGGN